MVETSNKVETASLVITKSNANAKLQVKMKSKKSETKKDADLPITKSWAKTLTKVKKRMAKVKKTDGGGGCIAEELDRIFTG